MDMTRRCLTEGCERKPAPGWARCAEHLVEWLDRYNVREPMEAQDASDQVPSPKCDWPAVTA
jgi:hypothetical protein